jgi:nucleoside-diphosphate-sugar epimerase
MAGHSRAKDGVASARLAAKSDGVIHTAFIHDFSKFADNCEIDRRAIEALGTVLEGSGRPLLVTSGVLLLAPGRTATEDDAQPSGGAHPRVSEAAATAFVSRGVRAAVVRLPQVHDRDKQGFVSYLMALAREKGVSAYVGDGLNRWTAVHRLDAGRLYRLALEKGEAGARYHAIAEEGVTMRDISARLTQTRGGSRSSRTRVEMRWTRQRRARKRNRRAGLFL